MGYDVAFQLIDARAAQTMLDRVLAGAPPPPSAFDARPDAASLLAQARALLLGADRAAAARAAGQLVALWSAETLPFVSTRNLAVTYHPLRMEDGLASLPEEGFTSPKRWLFSSLPEDLEWSGRLEGNASIGGYVWDARRAGAAVRGFYDELAPALRPRVLPLLRILRAAERHGLGVLESSDLLGASHAGEALLHWPGLARFGLDGGPLSAQEWRALRSSRLCRGDAYDAIDRALETDPEDAEARAELLALFNAESFFFEEEHGLRRALPWLARCLETEDLAAATRAYRRLASSSRGPAATPPPALAARLESCADPECVAYWVSRHGPKGERPEPLLAAALLRALCRTRPSFANYEHASGLQVRHLAECGADVDALGQLFESPEGPAYLHWVRLDFDARFFRSHAAALLRAVEHGAAFVQPGSEGAEELRALYRGALEACAREDQDAAVKDLAARVWLRLYERSAQLALPFSDYRLEDEGIPVRVAEVLLRAPASLAGLRAVESVLSSGPGWEDGEAEWLEDFAQQHREGLFALIDLGLASDDAADRAAALGLTKPVCLSDVRWEPVLRAALDRGDDRAINALVGRVPLEAATAPTVARAEVRDFAASSWGPSFSGLLALLPLGVDVVQEAMAALAAAQEGKATGAQETAKIALNFSSALMNKGWPRQALGVLEVGLRGAPAAQRANLLYNEACAWAKLGEGARAARSLGAAAALDPKQLDDARRDSDFDAVRSAPELVALWSAR